MTPEAVRGVPSTETGSIRGMFITDLDGTLLREGSVDREDIAVLDLLGLVGVPRVIATGRSPFSFGRIPAADGLPVDFLILSSGAAIMDVNTGGFLRTVSMSPSVTACAVRTLKGLGLDFAVHEALPENHMFLYAMPSGDNPDMERRIGLYRDHCGPLGEGDHEIESTQLVVIAPPEGAADLVPLVSDELGDGYSVVRTTSPLDGESLWIEVFPESVSKSSGAEWLAGLLGLEDRHCCAVGNDYNDADLLEWAGRSFVVPGSPPQLSRLHDSAGSVGEAAKLWLGEGALVPAKREDA